MGYLGNAPGESFISFAKQVFTIVNSQTAYTLNFAVVDENELRLVINNVVQEPGSGKAYTASGTTLTLASALTNGTDEMYCVFLGKARETVTVPTITKDKLNLISTSSSAGLEVKGDGTTDGTIQLNCSQNSHGIKLASPPHSAGQSYTLTFPQSISADTFLKTAGSGNLSFAAAGGITEADQWRLSADTNQNSNADVTSNWERNDSSGWSKIGTGLSESSGIFSFASTGIYLITFIATFTIDDGDGNVEFILKITTDNSSYNEVAQCRSGNSGSANISSTGISNFLFDVQNTSNYKFKFTTGSFASASKLQGATGSQQTGFTVIRLGDT